MTRREALTSLAALAGATGISLTPVTAHEASHVSVVILKCDRRLSQRQVEYLKAAWDAAVAGTDLQHVKTYVLDQGLSIEFVRR